MILSIIIRTLGSLLILLWSSMSLALDRTQLISIEADLIKYEYKKGIVHYDGHVHATQGETNLQAEQMIVYYNKQHKIKQVDAIGKLAEYHTRVHNNQDVLVASAETIVYYPLVGQVILKNQATVTYNKSVFTGPYIVYDLNKQIISSRPSAMSQAKITLEPIKELKRN